VTARRGNVVRHDDGTFEVLGLIKVAVAGPWWWQTEDLDDPGGAKGAIFRCLEADSPYDLGYLMAADVTGDPSEPDISRFEEADAAPFDRTLEEAIRALMASDGREMIKWMASELNQTPLGKGLMTAYIAHDQGRDRQYFDLRLRIRQSNAVIGGCFDIARKDDVAPAVWQMLQAAAYNSRISGNAAPSPISRWKRFVASLGIIRKDARTDAGGLSRARGRTRHQLRRMPRSLLRPRP